MGWRPRPIGLVVDGWSWRTLRPDILAGLAVAAYGIPQVMAYASLAGLPVQAGLWGLMLPLLAYALFGSSRQLSIGPESTTALMAATSVAPLAHGDPGRYAALAAAAALGVGLVCLLAYVMRLGFIAELLSHPILVGYLAGVALIMIATQLPALAGVPSDAHTAAGAIRDVVDEAGRWDAASLATGAATLGFLFLFQAVAPRAPGPLIAMLLATGAVVAFGLDAHGVAVVGPIPSELPGLELPRVGASDLSALIAPALAIALVGYSDTIVTARAFAARGGYDIDPNRELLGLGAANLGAGVSQSLPVSSSASRTAIGDAIGSRSQRYALVALVAVVVAVLVAGDLLSHFPKPALAAIVIYAATRLIDVVAFRRLARFRLSELGLAATACIGVLVLGILYGVAVAIGLSVIELLARIGRPHDGILGRVPRLAGMHDVDDYPDAEQIPGLLVYRYDAPLFFANAENFRRRALAAVEQAPAPVEWFLLNAEANVEVDITAIDALERLRETLASRGITFAMARVKQDLADQLECAGFLARVGPDRIFPTLPTAVAAFERQARASGVGAVRT